MQRALHAVAVGIRHIGRGLGQEAEHIEPVTKGVDRDLEAPRYAAVCVCRRDGDRRVSASVVRRDNEEIGAGDIRGIGVAAEIIVNAVLLVMQRCAVARLSVGVRIGPLHSVRNDAPRAVAVVCGNHQHKADVIAQRKQVVEGNGKACALARLIKPRLNGSSVVQIDGGVAGALGAVARQAAGGAADLSECHASDQNVKYVVVIYRQQQGVCAPRVLFAVAGIHRNGVRGLKTLEADFGDRDRAARSRAGALGDRAAARLLDGIFHLGVFRRMLQRIGD